MLLATGCEKKPTETITLPPDAKKLALDNSAFAFDLYQKLRSREGNLFFSPYSISAALAMTYAGARGDTEKQMAKTLHFSLDQEDLHPAFGELQAWLNQIQESGGITLRAANSLWPQESYKFLDEYLFLTKSYYGVSVTPVDYVAASEAACKMINKWVEDRTEHKIKDLIQPGILHALTRLVLVNGIYFKGTWVSRFDPADTRDTPFHVSPTKDVETRMMSQMEEVRYAEFKSAQILELPYVGDRLSMLIVLPEEIDGLGALERSLSVKNLRAWRERLHKRKVNIYLPKFTMTREFRLDETLQAMGMADAFSLPPADFSGMTGTPDLFISAVIHKAFVEVNEEGTEAAAGTALPAPRAHGIPWPPDFRADHPFLFLIQETRTGSILFLGRVADPTKSGE
jgi:serpin B